MHFSFAVLASGVWWALGPFLGLVTGAAIWTVLVWLLCPRCPRCGSIKKGNWPTDEEGRFHHAALCGNRGHVWDWQKDH
jgi:hypothetical protein